MSSRRAPRTTPAGPSRTAGAAASRQGRGHSSHTAALPPPAARVVGPGFHAQVHALVQQVPAGHVTTYGDVATWLGSPRVARHVGWALAALVDDERDASGRPVPWHRVINAQGRISHRGDVARAEEQRARLAAEGVEFDPQGRCDLARHRWRFADTALPETPLDPG